MNRYQLIDNIKVLLPISGIIIVVVLWFVGASHGIKRHKFDPFNYSFLFAYYYSFEMLWHEIDYKELNELVEIGTKVAMLKGRPELESERGNYNKEVLSFRSILGNLDNKEKEYVKNGVSLCIQFVFSIQDDALKCKKEYLDSMTKDFLVSDSSEEYIRRCSDIGMQNFVSSIMQIIEMDVRDGYEIIDGISLFEGQKYLYDERWRIQNLKTKAMDSMQNDLF